MNKKGIILFFPILFFGLSIFAQVKFKVPKPSIKISYSPGNITAGQTVNFKVSITYPQGAKRPANTKINIFIDNKGINPGRPKIMMSTDGSSKITYKLRWKASIFGSHKIKVRLTYVLPTPVIFAEKSFFVRSSTTTQKSKIPSVTDRTKSLPKGDKGKRLLPDLTFEFVSVTFEEGCGEEIGGAGDYLFPDNIYFGCNAIINIWVRNSGKVAVTTPFNVDMESNSGNRRWTITSLGAKCKKLIKYTIKCYKLMPNTEISCTFYVDKFNQIKESDESNNDKMKANKTMGPPSNATPLVNALVKFICINK